jgi:hypothetical protein
MLLLSPHDNNPVGASRNRTSSWENALKSRGTLVLKDCGSDEIVPAEDEGGENVRILV